MTDGFFIQQENPFLLHKKCSAGMRMPRQRRFDCKSSRAAVRESRRRYSLFLKFSVKAAYPSPKNPLPDRLQQLDKFIRLLQMGQVSGMLQKVNRYVRIAEDEVVHRIGYGRFHGSADESSWNLQLL